MDAHYIKNLNSYESAMQRIKIENYTEIDKHIKKIENSLTDYYKTAEDIFSFKKNVITHQRSNKSQLKNIQINSPPTLENFRLLTSKSKISEFPPSKSIKQKTILVKALFSHYETNFEGKFTEGKILNENVLTKLNYIKNEYSELKETRSRNLTTRKNNTSINESYKTTLVINNKESRNNKSLKTSENFNAFSKKIIFTGGSKINEQSLSTEKLKHKKTNSLKISSFNIKGFDKNFLKLEEQASTFKFKLNVDLKKMNSKIEKKHKCFEENLNQMKELRMFKPLIKRGTVRFGENRTVDNKYLRNKITNL